MIFAVLGDCRAPVAVGKAAVSRSEMQSSGMKGRGVCVLHTYKDYLWLVALNRFIVLKIIKLLFSLQVCVTYYTQQHDFLLTLILVLFSKNKIKSNLRIRDEDELEIL